jgi:hypothetical protein
MSPTRLTNIALSADLLAWIRVCQKLISKNEAKPIPSQPKNITTKLSAVTRKSIKPVNKDKYDIKRAWCGSPFIYSDEYKWTRLEIPVTTHSIITDKLSNVKPQLIINKSDSIHGAIATLHTELKTSVSNKQKNEMKKANAIANVDNKHAPDVPMKRPKQMHEIKLKNGNIKIHEYIKWKK